MHVSKLKLSLAAAAAVALALAGCTGAPLAAPGATTSASGPVSIRYLVEQPEDPTAVDRLKAHVADFEKQNSGITVKVEAMPSSNMRTVLQTQLRSGEGPDVFSWGSGPGYAGALAKAGLLYDLTAAYKKYNWPIYDFARERVTFDGKIVGVPGEMETLGLFYNKDLFTKLGIAEPQSTADLQAAAKKIAAAGVTPFGVSDKEGWQGGHLLSMALSSRIGSKGMEALLNGQTSWNSPDVVAALKDWQDMNVAGYLPDSPASIAYDSASSLFYSGKAAILPTGSWLISDLDKNASFKVGYIPFPAPNGPGVFAGGLGSGPFISANTKNPEAALKFVNFLASPENARWTVENLGTIPPQPVDTTGVKASPLFAQVLADTSKFSKGTGGFGYSIDVLTSDVFNKAMWDGVQAILSKQKTPEEVAQALDAAAKK